MAEAKIASIFPRYGKNPGWGPLTKQPLEYDGRRPRNVFSRKAGPGLSHPAGRHSHHGWSTRGAATLDGGNDQGPGRPPWEVGRFRLKKGGRKIRESSSINGVRSSYSRRVLRVERPLGPRSRAHGPFPRQKIVRPRAGRAVWHHGVGTPWAKLRHPRIQDSTSLHDPDIFSGPNLYEIRRERRTELWTKLYPGRPGRTRPFPARPSGG